MVRQMGDAQTNSVRSNSGEMGGRQAWSKGLSHAKASMPVDSRPMISFWIWLVPS